METRKILIEIDPETENAIRTMATRHGNRLKPFIEYLLRLQAGTVPPPSVALVKLSAKGPSAPEESVPVGPEPENEAEVVAARPQAPSTKDLPTRRAGRLDANFNERADVGIYTDGTEFRTNSYGKIRYHATIEEAREALKKKP